MKNKKPEIRFKGFSEEWEERSLKGITSDISDGDWIETNHIFSEGEYRIIQTGNLGLGEYLDKSNNAKFFHQKDFDEIKANEIFPNDILISRLAEPAGRTIILPETGYRMVTAVDVTIIRPDEDSFNSIFLMTQLNSENVLQVINENVSGTSHRRISRRNLEKTKLAVPILSEQIQIGNFFKNLDNLITLHQRKYDKLVNVKKAMLEKMFPKNGADVPEIRFKGFSGAWEEKTLGEIIDLRSGRDYKHLSNGNIPVYGTGGYMLSVNEALSYDKDAIGIGRKGTIDKPFLLKAPFWTVDTLFYAVPMEKNNLDFIYDIFQKINWKQKNEASGVPSLSKVAINGIQILISNYIEQEKIGNYFKNLDNLLTLHQGELGKLKNLKKAMLEKMFV